MGFFDKFKDTASVVANKTKEAGNSIGSATKNAVEKQKIKNAIHKEDLNIEKQYAEIGKKYVELFGSQPSLEFADNIKSIEVSKEEITKLTVQLNALEDYVTCACGAKVPRNASFCPSCGNAVSVTVEEPIIVEAEEVQVEEMPPVENQSSTNEN